MNVSVLHDASALSGRPDEQDAMVQVAFVRNVLEHLGHTSATVAVSLDLAAARDALRRKRPDVVFNLVESIDGDGRWIHAVPALLDSLGIAYTGSHTGAVLSTTPKVLSKQILRGAGLPTPDWMPIDCGSGGAPFSPGHFIVKPVWEDASLGIDDASVGHFTTAAEVEVAIRARADEIGHACFAERFVHGREFNVSVLEIEDRPHVLPVAEMTFVDFPAGKPRLVGYPAKWSPGSFEYEHTVRQFDTAGTTLTERLSGLSLNAWCCFGLRGYARVDFRVDDDGHPWILEVNANPCLSPDAGFAAAVEKTALTATAMIEHIIAAALRAPRLTG